MLEDIRKYIESLEEETIPQLSVNCVIMGFHERTLKVVVNKIMAGETMFMVLPGGCVKHGEDLTDSVERIVNESTGLDNILFRQFAVFGKASRSFANELALKAGLQSGSDQSVLDWFSKRFISLCYIALVDYRTIELNPTEYFESAQWFPVDQAEKLDMDHADILSSAREFLIKEMPYTPIASNLLPPKFTLPDLRALMESILDRNIDRPNFRRKILSTGMLEKVGVDNSGNRRPADIYRFKYGKHTALMDNFKFGF
jgi:ADP-ribose pyrophosphatase YjhB (NUDIX family)